MRMPATRRELRTKFLELGTSPPMVMAPAETRPPLKHLAQGRLWALQLPRLVRRRGRRCHHGVGVDGGGGFRSKSLERAGLDTGGDFIGTMLGRRRR